MSTFEIRVGEHYQYRHSPYQVVSIRNERVQLRSTDNKRSVIFQTTQILYSAYKHGTFIKAQEAPIDSKPEQIIAGLKPPTAKKFERICHYTLNCIRRFPGTLPPGPLQKHISKLAQESNDLCQPSINTVKRWIRLFRQGGESCLALIPQKRKKMKDRVDNQHPETKLVMEETIRQLYTIAEPALKSAVVDAIIQKLKDMNERRPETDQIPISSVSTYYRILRELDAYEVELKQKGLKHALKTHNWSTTRPRPGATYQLIEADTQELHVIIVDENGEPMGRPYLTALIDVYSRMIIGWFVSFNPPSLDTTLRALKISLSSENPYGGIGMRYIFDSGPEWIEKNLQRIITMLGGEICYCEPGTPNQKPHIESFFHTMSIELIHFMPGTTFSGITERGDYPSEQKASLTLQDVTHHIGRWLTEVYHKRLHTSLKTSPELAWKIGTSELMPPRRFSPSELKKYFWSAFRATPCNGRVRYKSLFWTGPSLAHLAHKEPIAKKLVIFYDPSDLGTAWACHPNYPDELFALESVDYDYQQGLTMHLHKLIQKRLTESVRKFDSRSARLARIQILYELSEQKVKSKKIRHKKHLKEITKPDKPLNYKSLKPRATTSQTSQPRSFHRDTPDNYSSSEEFPNSQTASQPPSIKAIFKRQ